MLSARTAPLRWDDVNTDDIAPAFASIPLARRGDRGDRGDQPKRTEQEQYRDNAFAAYRWNDDGTPREDFVLNLPRYAGAQILVAGSNFGCGSSRESAVWCLEALGVRCVIAPSFGDIFYGNCFQNGLLAVRLAAAEIESLMGQIETVGDPMLTVDLRSLTITAPDASVVTFEVGAYHREALLAGLDEIELTLGRVATIEAHEASYYRDRPWLASLSTN